MITTKTATLEPVTLEPATRVFLDTVNSQGDKPLYALSYADARKVLEDAQAGPIEKQPADVEERDLPVGPSGKVSVRIYRPQGAHGTLPAVLYLHGGGWILGSKNTHDRLLRDLVNGSGLSFVFMNYTPSPEAQFPIPTEEAYAAAKYVAEHGSELGLDGDNMAIAGDSAGGCLVAAVVQLAKQRGGPLFRDEGEAYASKLMSAEVDVTAVRYLGTVHDFIMLDALAHTPAAKSAILLASSRLRNALIGGK